MSSVSRLRERFPSRREMLAIFGLVSFPIFLWANLQVFREMPSWLLRLTTGELVGVMAYVEAFALVESAAFFVGMLTVMALLHGRWLEGHRMVFSLVVTLMVSLAAVVVHYMDESLRQWGLLGIAVPTGAMILGAAPLLYFTMRTEKWSRAIQEVVDRVILLSLLYTSLGLIGLLIVVVRNIS